MIREASGHRRRHAQRPVNPREVVVQEIERDRREWFSTFFEKPFVSRVNRRIPIRIVRF